MSMLSGIGLLKGIMTKMDWLDQNQRVLSQNVANADTPGYRPEMLKEVNFKSLMGKVAKGGGAGGGMSMTPVRLEATSSQHFGFGKTAGDAGEMKQKKIYEASPDDNGVVLEEQLFKANQNSINYQIATDLYRRNVGMIRMVLQGGRG